MTVINAVALAGGYTYRARENKVTITRAGDEERMSLPATHVTVVLPGDVIEVPERFF
jgi:polysaccharide export outer membrane protein